MHSKSLIKYKVYHSKTGKKSVSYSQVYEGYISASMKKVATASYRIKRRIQSDLRFYKDNCTKGTKIQVFIDNVLHKEIEL